MLDDPVFTRLISTLNQYMAEAQSFGDKNANGCFLATSGAEKQPSVRIVTIYDIDEAGFHFLAKKDSGKIIQLEHNPKVGLCFFWEGIDLQVTIEGIVEAHDTARSQTLWNKRDHHANISAWALHMAASDNQADEMPSYKSEVKQRFEGERLPLPESWSGYCIKPSRIDLWPIHWKKSKKHLRYTKKGGFWHESAVY